jgi:LAS superfamily LD-carboxypeptidase LdcB
MLKRKRKKMLPEPVKQVRLNDELRKYGNGKLPAGLLKPVSGGGQMYHVAAFWFNVMCTEAKKDGIKIQNVSEGYRSFERQEVLFLARYSKRPTTRVPKVTRKYQGRTWWLKRGKSPSATPATSNHGYGLAQDIDVRDPKVFRWLSHNAPKYGYYLQGKQKSPNGKPNPEYEAWHWQFCHL